MTAADRYVTTADVRAAVRGHETDILDGLGIDWKQPKGHPHIHCPYPDHADEHASWRWDAEHAKDWCTCAQNGHRIIDVVMKVEGHDFEEAKIMIAKILYRNDLIRSNGRSKDHEYLKTDAASLPNAPDVARDDSLPVDYFAHRLGMSRDQVPIPSTMMVGHKALPYYDAPTPGSKAKPKLVGKFPCAVFQTVAADGRTHAHRIYVAPAGAGKADLGCRPDGHTREPKKSATATDGNNTSGCSVLWGDPSKAPTKVISEGIETGAAIALALDAPIDGNEIAVAAAISASGIAAYQPYPGTEYLVVAADRDEAPKPDGTPGSRRGEQAARTSALKHHGLMRVAIALPGTHGETADWLDVLRRDGPEAVRAGIAAAVPFEPTLAEADGLRQRRDRAAELDAIARTYPLPAMNSVTLSYESTATGKVMVHKVEGRSNREIGSTEPVRVPIATPFGVSARLRYIDQANVYGLRCMVQDMNGQPRVCDFDRAELATMGATSIRAKLFEAGLRSEADGDNIVVQCLKAADPKREILVVQWPGWQKAPDWSDPVFVAPNGAVIGAPHHLDLELAAPVRMAPDVAGAGSLDGWRAAIDAAVSVQGCAHWVLGVLAGLAGPLVALTGLDTCGINLSGRTSSGKSLAQKLAASAWSTPDIRRPGLCQSARSTDNAVEALAQRATGTVLSLDELAHVTGTEAAKMIYTIAGGIGKQRMNADARLRDPYTWKTFAILSGECSLEEKIRSDGGTWAPGMAVRIVDLDVTGINRQVDAATLQRINNVESNYGHAGPAFVRKLIEQGIHGQALELRERILRAAAKLAGGATADAATVRSAIPLAVLMIAGGLARAFELIPVSTPVSEAIEWAWNRFRQSPDAVALDFETQVIANLHMWIAKQWDVTIRDVEEAKQFNNREAVAWYDDTAVYIPKDRLREAAGSRASEAACTHICTERPQAMRPGGLYCPALG